jgi:hypothetical protein
MVRQHVPCVLQRETLGHILAPESRLRLRWPQRLGCTTEGVLRPRYDGRCGATDSRFCWVWSPTSAGSGDRVDGDQDAALVCHANDCSGPGAYGCQVVTETEGAEAWPLPRLRLRPPRHAGAVPGVRDGHFLRRFRFPTHGCSPLRRSRVGASAAGCVVKGSAAGEGVAPPGDGPALPRQLAWCAWMRNACSASYIGRRIITPCPSPSNRHWPTSARHRRPCRGGSSG